MKPLMLVPIRMLQSSATGFVSNGPAKAIPDSPFAEALIGAALGAFLGLIAAFVVSKVMKGLAAHDLLNQIGQTRLAVITSLLGATGFVLATVFGDQD